MYSWAKIENKCLHLCLLRNAEPIALRMMGETYLINDGVEAPARKYQACFQIIQVSSSKNVPEISLSRPQPIHISSQV